MPLEIIRNDITKMAVDAIVNPTDEAFSGSGGVDKSVHRAAGKQLKAACGALGGCELGKAKLTEAYNLPCKHVIHTVGPVWHGGGNNEEAYLASCYKECLSIAKEKGFKSVAFPLIAAGVYGYPKDKALKTAINEIGAFLLENEITVYIVVYDKKAFQISEKLFSDIAEYIDDNYVNERASFCQRSLPLAAGRAIAKKRREAADYALFASEESLSDALATIDESFSQMLLRKIDEKGMKDAECYKKANIDRKLFSKIRSDIHYRPSKQTAIAFAIALELTLSETEDMLKKAGFALSQSNKADIIIKYFISHGKYDIYEINEALFAFDQALLGA